MFVTLNNHLEASRLKREEGQKGFTLIELLVVVIIIGILAAIAIPVFLNQRESAWKSSVESDLKNAALVIETYGSQNNGSFNDLAAATITATTTPKVGTAAASTLTYNKASKNNNLTVAKVTGGYTITGYNTDLGSTNVLVYNSTSGGIGAWTK